MTTGEKLAKLRKENGYTQEALAEILLVSRQSISKWESDLAFPETDKLIILSNLYKCSIDYLLKDDVVESKGVENNTSIKLNLKKYLATNLFPFLWTIVFVILNFILYALPIFPGYVTDIFGNSLMVNFNTYAIIGSSYYEFGNVVFLIQLLLQISLLIIAIIIYFLNNRQLYITRIVIGVISSLIWLIIFLICDKTYLTSLLLFIISVVYSVGMKIIKKNKYVKDVVM